MKSAIKFVLQPATAVVFAAMMASLSLGQQGSQASGRNDPSRVMRESEREMSERMSNLRIMERGENKPAEQHAAQLAFAQLSEDYLHIQIVNNKMMQAVVRGDTLNLTFVAESASEIKQRAGRLKANLVLPELEKGPKRSKAEAVTEIGQLRLSLSALGELVAGFVENPIFKDVDVVNVNLTTKARRDLEEIIELSGQIKKSSEKLSKAVHKSQ